MSSETNTQLQTGQTQQPQSPSPATQPQPTTTTTTTTAQDQNLLMDFSSMFKRTITKKPFKSKPLQQNKPQNTTTGANNWLLQIPTKITTTIDDLKQRKVLDLRRWFCLSRPQYERSCGISSLVSVWNYLYSRVGVGELQPLTVEKGLEVLGVVEKGEEFENVDFGEFTGNGTLLGWWDRLCKKFGLKGKGKVLVKVSGEGKTQVGLEEGRELLLQGLKSTKKGYIYHAYDHYFCPIGYQLTPNKPLDAYKKLSQINIQQTQLWLIIGQTSKNHPVFHIKKWKDIQQDLETQWPNFYNLRDTAKGIQRRPNATQQNQKQPRGTSHCIMEFSIQ